MKALSDWLVVVLAFCLLNLWAEAARAASGVDESVELSNKSTEKFAQKSLYLSRVKSAKAAATFSVSAKGASSGDQINAESHNNKLYIEVRKKSGIGSAQIQLKSGHWPDTAQVRFFDFSRLEGFTARGGAKIDCIDGAPTNRRTFLIDLLPLHVDAENSLELNWVDVYRH